ncbi:putative toxin-antitoxin system toxin component, PIN family [Candidatus Uhrbacteria bacterium RIFCSPHIGHO2_12_FULL_54_23]|uniref:Putative toxin-antitoxin system toxin component, PIN family n=3 Tax=Candidatus Uhriibacteriota TaxID=1752732 RepID=A0A1F7UHW0_9BACT|nr:MAG: putative toxin-antitoxin system toxin component, PIN family [Candidatus Uhrbacteria bacterium RIFCSPHIGHO2_12_FULL_54_23]OGL85540.1 MAG: putative toxin-antitoxin system toxin component, PIN family [Candidatus Uhrbacteria bacterium RIFCSPLOWO2_01_FULL_55_36]OGL89626.1 MAG: putative toxin-antitoxin system toxin component, PIN family [Candidatus Uhrbacteria bacterium RIFCSPLOWO2_02_FULL_54_37]
MITAVIDTNVLIDATADLSGYAHQVIALVVEGNVKAVASRRIEDEYRALIAKAADKRARQELDEFFDMVARVRTHERAEARSKDREDQKFLDCASTAGADFIITNDHHLLDLGASGTTKIITPEEFISLSHAAQDPEGKSAWASWVKEIFGK